MPYYNHNDHYAELVLRCRPPACASVLDVGCGDGRLARRMVDEGVAEVVGIDTDAASIAAARLASGEQAGLHWVEGSFLDHDFGGQRFDFVTAVASLHHMPLDAALAKLVTVVRPGGTVAVLGLHRSSTPLDTALAVAAVPVNAWLAWRRPSTPSAAPVLPPTTTLTQVRAVAAEVAPGARVRRLLMWRYLLTWTAPQT